MKLEVEVEKLVIRVEEGSDFVVGELVTEVLVV